MKINKIKINNYRLLEEAVLELEDNLSTIIGKNNTGKTSFISLIRKFINSKSEFSYDDFNLNFQKEIIESIEMDYNIDNYRELAIKLETFIEYNEEDNLQNIGSLLMDLDESYNQLVFKFEYVLKYEEYKNIIKDFKEFSKVVKGKDLNFYLRNNYKSYFKLIRKVISNQETEKLEYKIIDDISKVINIEYISAKREVQSNDFSSSSNKTLSRLSYKYFDNINELGKFEITELKKELFEMDEKLTKIYGKTFKKVIDNIKKFSYDSNCNLQVISQLEENNVLKDNTNVMYENDGYNLPEDYNGLGYMNLFSIMFQIHIALDRLKKVETKKKADINLLFIEEPEVHTHPQMQYIFIRNIKDLIKEYKEDINLQTIITTHSPHIVSQSDFEDIKYFHKLDNNSIEIKNLRDLEILYKIKKSTENKQRYDFVKRYLTINKSELFFADKVIFIEGDTERILLPTMLKKIDVKNKDKEGYVPLISQNISIVEVGAYSHVFDNLIKFLGIKTLIVTDIDSVKEAPKECVNGSGRITYEETRVKEGISTSNASIKYFLKERELSQIKTDNCNILINKDGNWEKNKDGNVCICFQGEENGYHARSFEDAFISKNKSFLLENKDCFNSLKNINILKDDMDCYYIAQNCIKKKSSFAIDILYYSNKDFDNWSIPQYIEKGLEWLAK